MAIAYYHIAGQDSVWHAGSTEIPASGGVIAVGADGANILCDSRFWSIFNTGVYDSVGVKTDNAVDVFVRTALVADAAPLLTYAAATAQGIQSIPVSVSQERLFRPASDIATGYNLTKPDFVLFIKPLSGTVAVLLTPNEYIARGGQK